jgi:hypothetical protein
MFPEIWHRRLFLFGLIGMATGLLFGSIFISIPQMILGANWFLEKNYKSKIISLYKNKFFWILCSLFFLHLIGLLYTDDLQAGIADIKIKVPLLILAILFLSTKSLNQKEIKLLFKIFFLGVIISTIFCYLAFLGFTKKNIIDVRSASIFISHIRFSLIITFGIFSILYFIKSKKDIILGVFIILWLLFFMYQFQMATGFFLIIMIGFIYLFYYMFKKINLYINMLICIILSFFSFKMYQSIRADLLMYYTNPNSVNNVLLKQTVNKNHYSQDTLFDLAENGNLITVNFCDVELEKEWHKKSKLPYDGLDKNGNNLRFTLLRYMASKGLKKDSMGISILNPKDIINIENGVSNYLYPFNSGLIHKWRELVLEYTKYKRGEDPSGQTLTMRVEFWKASVFAIQQNILFGVGTGDIQQALNKAYDETNSKLTKRWRLRCHNQYLAITLAFGVVGLFLFLFYFLYPLIVLREKFHVLFWPFIAIILMSFFTEDTLESQAGLNFFACFYTLFIWLASSKEKSK